MLFGLQGLGYTVKSPPDFASDQENTILQATDNCSWDCFSNIHKESASGRDGTANLKIQWLYGVFIFLLEMQEKKEEKHSFPSAFTQWGWASWVMFLCLECCQQNVWADGLRLIKIYSEDGCPLSECHVERGGYLTKSWASHCTDVG